MAKKNKVFVVVAIISLFIIQLAYSYAQEPSSFQGEVNSNNINVRSDSTISSEVICNINNGQYVEVISELYKWYKIRLPKTAPSFIKKDLVVLLDDKTAKTLKDNVNIRLGPSESSAILGKVSKNEVVNVLEVKGDWYRIEPINDSFGWIHKKFVDKLTEEDIKLIQKTKEERGVIGENISTKENITIEGIIRPKVIRRIATHKLISTDNKIFLLKGDKKNLDAFNFHKAKVVGKLNNTAPQGYSVIEIIKVEVLD